MRWLRTIFLLGLCLGAIAFGTLNCGGSPSGSAGGDSQGTAPPVDIPIPISNLITVSGPDANGEVRVTGAPGAVLNGALVRVSNLGQRGLAIRFSEVFLASAWAQQTAAEVTANADGSFQLTLKAQIGDTLRVVQILSGQESPPLDLIVNGNILSLDIFPKALGIETAQGSAFIAGSEGDQGQVFRLDLEGLPGNFPELVMSLPNFSGITELRLKAGSPIALAISPQDEGLYRLTLDGSEPALLTPLTQPLSIDIADDSDQAGIGTGEAGSTLRTYDAIANQLICSIDLEHPDDPSLQALRSPLLAATSPTPGIHLDFIVLTQFSDLSWLLGKVRIHGGNCSSHLLFSATLPELLQPGELAVESSGTLAWLSDRDGDRVFRIDLESAQVQSVEVGKAPLGLALSQDFETLWVVNQGDNSISAVNLIDLSTRSRDGIGLAPSRIAIDAAHVRALVLSTLDQTMVLVDLNF